MTLEIEQQNAIKAYNKADENGKALLVNLFGEKNLSQKITDRIKTYEDACEVFGIDPDLGLSCSKSGVYKDIENIQAYAKLQLIVRALNEGWTPDWSNSNEYKYYPFFKKGGSGLVFDDVGDWCTVTDAGSRLCFKSRELAEYAAKQFIDIYTDYMDLR